MIKTWAWAAFLAALAGSPLLLAFVPEASLPSGLAYLAHDGRDVIGFVVCLAIAAYLSSTHPVTIRHGQLLRERLEKAGEPAFSLTAFGLASLVALCLMPSWRWNAEGFGGDEPKYLRMAESLLHDLDVDVQSESHVEWTAARFSRNARRLLRDAGDEVGRLFTGTAPSENHRWARGNWTLDGLHGGWYYVQSPGLPILLLPGLVAREVLAPPRPAAFLPLLTLAALWAFAATQTVKLASEVSTSRVAGLIAGIATALSAPLLIGGFHFYPESAAAALLPWLIRYARSLGPTPNAATALALGLACGFLPWLHPKFLLIAAVLVALLVWRLSSTRLALGFALGGAALVFGALLLFDHHVTGLLTPDALYQRYGSAVYRGPAAFASPLVLNGLITALFGARDGLLVMARLFVAAVLAIRVCWLSDRRSTLELSAVFASLWVAAAVHEGGAPGPPGRLMAPVACVLAAFLALGLVRLWKNLAYLLTLIVLAALTITITNGMLDDWRRTVNPYREAFGTPARDFAKDLPDGPGRTEAPLETHKSRDRLRGLCMTAILAGWATWFARHPQGHSGRIEWQLAYWIAGLWGTLALAAFALWALGP